MCVCPYDDRNVVKMTEHYVVNILTTCLILIKCKPRLCKRYIDDNLQYIYIKPNYSFSGVTFGVGLCSVSPVKQYN